MFGFFIGALTVFGVIAVLKHRSWHGYHRAGHGFHGHGHGGGFGHHGPWGRHSNHHDGDGPSFRGADWIIDRLISRINARPEQAQVLRLEVGEFLEHAGKLRSELGTARRDIGEAMRADSFDETVMGDSFAHQDEKIRELRERLVGSLVRIHDVLDPDQREQVADLLENGPGFGRGSGRGRRGW